MSDRGIPDKRMVAIPLNLEDHAECVRQEQARGITASGSFLETAAPAMQQYADVLKERAMMHHSRNWGQIHKGRALHQILTACHPAHRKEFYYIFLKPIKNISWCVLHFLSQWHSL